MTNPISDRPAHKGYPNPSEEDLRTYPRTHEASEASENEESDVWGIVSIGRNKASTSGQNLSAYDWEHFCQEVRDLFATVDFQVEGFSVSEEHGSEETYQVGGTFLAFSGELDRLRSRLAYLATWYFQDAISLTIGGGERICALKLEGSERA